MKRIIFINLFLISFIYANLQIPASPQKHPIALINGVIHTITKGTIKNGAILIEKGKIKSVGKEIKIPKDCEIIDLKGKHVYPGFIDANSIIGLVEISAIRATLDYAETGDFNPNVRAEIAINPDSELLPVTRANGILLCNIVPQGGIITGTSSLIMLDGWTWEDMVLKRNTGIHLKWPSKRPFFSGFYLRPKSEEELKKEYKEKIKKIKKFFEDAYAYMKAKESENEFKKIYHKTDERFEAMIECLKGRIPLFVHADDYRQIREAIDFFSQFKIKIVIVGGYDAWRVADLLKEKNIPVIITGIHTNPKRRGESYDTPYLLPYRLYKAGVKFCIANSANAFSAPNARNLPYKVATAVAFGLPYEEGLKAITLYPAEILGVNDRVGSIEEGKDATLIITDGDPLDIKTNVSMAFIQGRKIDLNNKHKILYEKYKIKYERMGILNPNSLKIK